MTKELRKKIIISSVSFAVIIAVTVLFTCLYNIDYFRVDRYGDTFEGYVSFASYRGREEAAQAFVESELTGKASNPQYIGYHKISDLTDNEVEQLNSRHLTDETIVGGEKSNIEYESDLQHAEVGAYLLDTESGKSKYYVLPPSTGEAVTNAYFSTVLDGNKYLNCTSTTTVNMLLMDLNVTYKQKIYFADDKAYFDQELPGMISEVYFAENEYGVVPYMKNPKKNDGKFYTLTEINQSLAAQRLKYELKLSKGGNTVNVESLKSIRDITDFAFMMNIDASYFVKTNYGFAMPEDKYKQVCKMLVGDSCGADFDKEYDKLKVHFRSQYYVSEGRLCKSETVLRMLFDGDLITVTITTAYTDFGSTQVKMPR